VDRGEQRAIALQRLPPAAQDARVAGLEAQRRGIGGHIGPGLVDHRDHAERDPDPLDLQAIRAGLGAVDPTQDLRCIADLGDRACEPGDPAIVEHQPIEQRGGGAGIARRGKIAGVGCEDGGPVAIDRQGDRPERPGALLGVRLGDDPGRAARRLGDAPDLLGALVGSGHSRSQDDEIISVNRLVDALVSERGLDGGGLQA
jgi:hypothetical protein